MEGDSDTNGYYYYCLGSQIENPDLPPPPVFTCNERSENRNVSFSFCCIHAHGCIHNQIYSLAPLWFPALELSFINSCTVIPAHS